MKCVDVARAFGMSVGQFADQCGYSRQTLYNSEIRNSRRAKAVICDLKALNERMLRMDQEEAQRRFEERMRAIDDFEQRIKNAGVNSDD